MNGIYWRFDWWRCFGFLVVIDNGVLAYPIWGTKRELWESWREYELRIPLGKMRDLNLCNGDSQ